MKQHFLQMAINYIKDYIRRSNLAVQDKQHLYYFIDTVDYKIRQLEQEAANTIVYDIDGW